MEQEMLEMIVLNIPNFAGLFVGLLLLYKQVSKLTDILGDELRAKRERIAILEAERAGGHVDK